MLVWLQSHSRVPRGGGAAAGRVIVPLRRRPHLPDLGSARGHLDEVAKKDCTQLVDGLLLFEPSKTMRTGQWYSIFARLTRSPGIDILQGLDGSRFTVVKQRVSCEVSMNLDSEEAGAFAIEKVPADRKDEQLLIQGSASQWDWRVQPHKHGTLHLLLYVSPILYVDGIGERLREFREPPKIITVTPDYVYETGVFLKENWTIISVLLVAVFIPLFLWFRRKIIDRFGKDSKKKPFGFVQ
jgi:hypothetical protein